MLRRSLKCSSGWGQEENPRRSTTHYHGKNLGIFVCPEQSEEAEEEKGRGGGRSREIMSGKEFLSQGKKFRFYVSSDYKPPGLFNQKVT